MRNKSVEYTVAELRTFDGTQNRRKFVAYNGFIYDVTDCPKWRSEMHEEQHFPAQDLTGELIDAPHNKEVFDYPCVKKVGRLLP